MNEWIESMIRMNQSINYQSHSFFEHQDKHIIEIDIVIILNEIKNTRLILLSSPYSTGIVAGCSAADEPLDDRWIGNSLVLNLNLNLISSHLIFGIWKDLFYYNLDE